MADNSLFVARDSDLQKVQQTWAAAAGGTAQLLRLQAPFGGGRRALMGEFFRNLSQGTEDVVIWRAACLDQENGLQWLVRMYGSLVATLTSDVLRRGKIEMILNSQLPSQPAKVQRWYQEFIGTLKESTTDSEKGTVNLRLPRENPLIGLIEVTTAIARRQPIILELQNPYAVYSLALPQFVESLYAEARDQGCKLMIVLYDEPESDITKRLFPVPLLDLYERRGDQFATHEIAPWGADEAARYLASRELSGNAARMAEIANGRPGFIAELTDILQERELLDSDLDGVTMASLVPMDVDADELDEPDEEPAEGERKHAGEADAGQIAFIASLLGQAFPSGLVADMGGYDRDSVDDLLDAMEDLFEEVQFSEELGTWIYRFTKGSWREGVLEANDTEDGHALARRVGLFMERFLVPRGYGFITKTARIYAEHGADRSHLMRTVALSNDNGDIWGLCYDLTRYFDEVTWPEPLRRTIYMNLLERLVGQGNVQASEQVHAEATEWATANEDRELTAWLLFNGSRLDARRQDFYRARDRAQDALKLYEALDNKSKCAEIHNHLAGIELQDGNPNAALDQVNKAMDLGKVPTEDGNEGYIPGVLANAEHIRGLVARRAGNAPEAAEHFKRANQVAGQAGIAVLAMDSGTAYGEAMLASGQTQEARDALARVTQIATQLRNPQRERSARELLAQAEGALRNFPAAAQNAARVLQLSQQLKFERALPIDLYNLGFFHFASGKPNEALPFLQQAEARIGELGNHPVVKELYYFLGLALLQNGQGDKARAALQKCLKPAQAANDFRKLVTALDALAGLEANAGNADVAKKLLGDAIEIAKANNMKDERKALRKKLDSLEG